MLGRSGMAGMRITKKFGTSMSSTSVDWRIMSQYAKPDRPPSLTNEIFCLLPNLRSDSTIMAILRVIYAVTYNSSMT